MEETFRFLGVMYGLSRESYERNMLLVDSLFDIKELLRKTVRVLSLGQRTRCEIAAAVLHRPRLLLLDEPTIGLDLLVKDQVREGLLRLSREHGVTVMLASHDLGDVEALCQRALLITRGSLTYDGTLKKLRSLAAPSRTIEFTLGPDTSRTDIQLNHLASVSTEVRGDKLIVSYDGNLLRDSQVIGEVFRVTASIVDLRIKEPTLDDALRRLYVDTSRAVVE